MSRFSNKSKLTTTNTVPSHPPLKEGVGEEQVISSAYTSTVYRGLAYINTGCNKPEYIVDRLIYRKTLNLFIGRPKGGKSTNARTMIKSILDNEKFLGYETLKTNILYCPFDEPSYLVKDKLKKLKISNLDNLFITLLAGNEVDNDLEEIINICLETKSKIVIIDLFSRLLAVEDSSKYSEVERCLRKFREAAEKYDISFVFLHHSNKKNDSFIGSQSIAGSMDNLIYFYDNHGEYFFETEGRFEKIPKTKIYFDPISGLVTLAESKKTIEEKIINYLQSTELGTRDEMLEIIKTRSANFSLALNNLIDNGTVEQINDNRLKKYKLALKTSQSEEVSDED